MAQATSSRTALVRRARRINRELARLYPDASIELNFRSPLELLVAAILSAQTTDRRVNEVTRALFAQYRTAADYAAADRAALEKVIEPTGYFRSKAKTLISLGQVLCDRFGGEVPDTLEELVSLPGVGRKTANVILGDAFGKPSIVVDTHFARLARRFGWTAQTDPDKIEHDVAALLPPREWTAASRRVIWHGRRVCHARRPACGACGVARWCPSFGAGPCFDHASGDDGQSYDRATVPERWNAVGAGSSMWMDMARDPRFMTGTAPEGERATLLRYLRRYRLTMEMKCADLDPAQLARQSVPPSTMSLLGLIRHMADVERHWFRRVMAQADAPPLYWSEDLPAADWLGAVADPAVVDDGWRAWQDEVAFAEKFVADSPGLGIEGINQDGTSVELRSVLVHMIEEYARHCGHADLLRERIDGRVGQ